MTDCKRFTRADIEGMLAGMNVVIGMDDPADQSPAIVVATSAQSAIDETLTFRVTKDGVTVEAESPYGGDSLTGIGVTVEMELSLDDARTLAAKLLLAISEMEQTNGE